MALMPFRADFRQISADIIIQDGIYGTQNIKKTIQKKAMALGEASRN